MAKFTNIAKLKGDFTFSDMNVVVTTKESIDRYDLGEILKHFDGKTINISISDEEPITPKGH